MTVGTTDSVGAAKTTAASAARGMRIAPWLAAVISLVLICSAILAAGNVVSIGARHEKNYNEGWNVYNAERLIARETLYDDNYWRVNNYPIVSFLVVAGANTVTRDLLLSGRVVALVAFIAIGVLAAVVTWRLGGSWTAAVFSGACALGFYYLAAPDWIAVDDPQSLAEALMLAGLATYVGRPPSYRALSITAFFIILAGFTKHNLLAIPVAISADLALRVPRRLLFWIALCAGFAVGFLILTQLVGGGAFLDHLFSPRVYSWYHVHYHLMKFVRLFKIPLVALALSSWFIFRRNRLVLAFYGALSIVAGALLSGFEGASYNMMQDAAVFLAIALGLMIDDFRRWLFTGRFAARAPASLAAALVPALLAAPILGSAANTLGHIGSDRGLLAAERAAEQSFAADVVYLRERPGERICESLLLCHEAGVPFALDPFNSREYILAGKLDQSQLIRRVVARDFSVIQLRADICDDPASTTCHILHYPRKFNRFTDEFLYTVDQYYRIDRRSPLGVFYVPK